MSFGFQRKKILKKLAEQRRTRVNIFMSLQEFDKTFGIHTSIEEEKIKFINRIENTLFSWFSRNYDFSNYRQLFQEICYHLGLDANELILQISFLNTRIPDLKSLSNKDFKQTLRVVVALYNNLAGNLEVQNFIENVVKDCLQKSYFNLGVKWVAGTFYPTGDAFLDTELIEKSVSLLGKYPNEEKDLKNALENYNSKSLYGVVENCFIV